MPNVNSRLNCHFGGFFDHMSNSKRSYLFLVICIKQPMFSSLPIQRVLGLKVRLSPYNRVQARVQIRTTVVFSFSFCSAFFLKYYFHYPLSFRAILQFYMEIQWVFTTNKMPKHQLTSRLVRSIISRKSPI